MCDKTPDELVATRDGLSERAPARRLARLVQCTCLVGCGTLFAIPVGLVLIVLVWQWRLNRNPDPFPWRPASEWTLSQKMPWSLDFVEEDGSLIVFCLDYQDSRRAVPTVVRCDVETGKILSEHALPFPVAALAVSPHSDSVLIAGVPPSPHEKIPRRRSERPPFSLHVLRIASQRLPDWAVEAGIEEEIKYSGSSYELAYSLHVVAMPSRRAWVVGIGSPEEDEYRVALRDEKTLAEIESRSVPSQRLSRYRSIAVDTENASRVLIGREVRGGYRWDSWDSDSGEATFAKVPWANGLPSPLPSAAGWNFGLPHGAGLSDLVVRGGAMGLHVNALSAEGVFAASTRTSESTASMPVPLPPVRTDLAIWSLAPEKLIVAGKLQGKENAITTLRFSRDNRFLVTGHQGGTIRVWKLPRDPGDVSGTDGSAESRTPAPRTDDSPEDWSAVRSWAPVVPAIR